MIGRLRLQNWRAYDSLDVELGPGATFVVASNGIGKTSLVMAAAWGIFGDIAGVRGADEIRGDAAQAVVTVDLHLPTAGAIEITRSVDQRGRSEVGARLGDRELSSQEELDEVLAQEYGADAHVLAQLTFMIHGGLHETQTEFDLRDHLAGLFGVRPLFEAAQRADAVRAETASTLRRTKVVERKDARSRDELVAAAESAEAELRGVQASRERAVAASNEVSERLRAAQEWDNYRSALSERETKLGSYADVATAQLGRTVDPSNVAETLAEWEATETRTLSEIETEAATARGRAEAVRESVERLGASDAVCPTCLRPFGEHDAQDAAAEHARVLDELTATIADADERARGQRTLVETLRRILADIRSVPTPVEPSSSEPDGDVEQIREAYDAARAEVQQLDQDVAVKTTALAGVREALDEIERNREVTAQLEELYRLEALAQAASDTLRQTADRIMEQHIEPLVAEVGRRWKQAFGRGGLQLSADGRITRSVGSRTLPFAALSGGERVWALLVARLLVSSASTRAPFVWLDEPLEHLDPRLRRIVAGTLAMASTRAGLKQVIVTTYEAPIAQQLMEDVPSASLVYVTAAG